MIIFFIIDGISHQKFRRKAGIAVHVVGIPIWLISMFILSVQEFKFSLLIYPGILLILIGLFIAFKGFHEIWENLLRAKGVYRKGLYSKVRHPVYLGLIIAMLGLVLLVYSLLFFIYAIATILMIFWLAYYEEKHLIKRFGKRFLNYKKEVPMLLPFKFKSLKIKT